MLGNLENHNVGLQQRRVSYLLTERVSGEILQLEIQVSGVHTGGTFSPRIRNEE